MSAALDHGARSALEHFVQRARRLLEEDLAHEAEGRFGIHVADGVIEDEFGLHLDPAGLGARRDVVEILQFLSREEPSGADAVARLIREAAFTHLNRLVAIRIAEAIQLLPESLAKGSASVGFKELLEVAPLLARDASGGYWRYLQMCGDELASDLPQLFDPRNPLLELAPSPAAFDDLVEMIGVADLNQVWDAPDALGWAYQFFNSGDERRAMRDASASPRNSRELAVRNQFFTPRYVVDFLVQNSLGRRLLEAEPDSGLADHLPMLLDPPTEVGAPLALAEVRVLDPACGSGHFLLGAYDVLERAWELQGVSPADAAPHIVSSLCGVDIDARCVQVAAAAVIIRARRHCKDSNLPIPDIITARALPEPTGGWDALLATLPHDRRQLVVSIRDALDLAPVLGPLLKVEELLASEIRSRVVGADDDPMTLFRASDMGKDAFGRAEADVLKVLQDVADKATSGPADRLFAAEAQDAIRFVEAMRGRFDAVLMNPPFGEPVAETKKYLKAAYPEIPSNLDLLAPFVARGLELCRSEGSVGAITSRACLFLATFERWRRSVFVEQRLVALADLGHGVMQQAMVEAAAYVLTRQRHESDRATFIRVLEADSREERITSVIADWRNGQPAPIFSVAVDSFALIPGSPIAYWVPDELRDLFGKLPAIEGTIADVRRGSWPGDDFRYLRLWWEPERATVGDRHRFVDYAKGGEYSPYVGDPHLLVAWDSSRGTFRDFHGRPGRPSEMPENSGYYFRPGLTWPRRTQGGFNPRILPAGCIFADKGPAIFTYDGLDPLVMLAWLNSRTVHACVEMLTSFGSYEVGVVQRLPWVGPVLSEVIAARIGTIARSVVTVKCVWDMQDETNRRFVAPLGVQGSGSLMDRNEKSFRGRIDDTAAALELLAEIDDLLADALELGTSSRSFLNDEVGPLVGRLEIGNGPVTGSRRGRLFRPALWPELESAALDQGVAPRYLSAYALQPLMETWSREQSSSLFSYLVGCAFGRWDLRIAEDIGLAPPIRGFFNEIPQLSPGMLGEDVGGTYPVQLPSNGLLVDEPGHEWDLERAIVVVAEFLFRDVSGALSDLLALLGSSSLRSHLRSRFFKEHLARYSKSRRKAPIYWPLTVPSGRWGVWIYAPALSRETVYAVGSEALRRERYAQEEITRLERELERGAPLQGAKVLDKALDEERNLAEELRRFREEAERIAGLGWEPDLDDGIVLCAAPLADLFPMWKEPAQYRKELRAGKYEWSTVSKWADQL